MRILTRIVMVLGLLGGLAYGSYALGLYVLSHKLFGTSVKPSPSSGLETVSRSTRAASSVTRQTGIKGKPHVEVSVLPANEAGPGPEPPPIDELERATAEEQYTPGKRNRQRIVTPESFRVTPRRYYDSEYSSSDDEDRPRRRRRRRTRRRSTETTVTADAMRTARSDSANPGGGAPLILPEEASSAPLPERPSSSDASSGSRDSSPRRSRERSGSSSEGESSAVEERPRRRRTERRRERVSQPRQERTESPVPRPEGGGSSGGDSGGGDSPVPQPE